MLEFRVEAGRPDRHALLRAAAVLRSGGIVAYRQTRCTAGGKPGERGRDGTLYRIRTARRSRDSAHRIGDRPDRSGGRRARPATRRLADAFWPGPLTLVIPPGRASTPACTPRAHRRDPSA